MKRRISYEFTTYFYTTFRVPHKEALQFPANSQSKVQIERNEQLLLEVDNNWIRFQYIKSQSKYEAKSWKESFIPASLTLSLQERKLDWFPRLRTSSLDTVDSDSSAFEIKKLSSLLEDTKHDLKTVCTDIKALQRNVRTYVVNTSFSFPFFSLSVLF